MYLIETFLSFLCTESIALFVEKKVSFAINIEFNIILEKKKY